MPEPTAPLTDEQLAKIRAELERTTHPEWLAHTTAGQLLAEVERQRAQLALAQELYVRVPIDPVSHVVVRREHPDVDRWAVTDGALTGLRVWVDGRWQYVGDIGRKAAFRWHLEQVLAVAREAAVAEARSWVDAVARSKEQPR